MAGYKLLIKPSAAKELDAIDGKKDRQRIVSRIQALASNPEPAGHEKLAGAANGYRLRQGDRRVVYTTDDEARIAEIVKIGNRREVYRKLRSL